MPSLSITRKLAVLCLKHPKSRHVLKPIAPWLMKSLTKDYVKLTSSTQDLAKKQEQ